MYIHRKMRRRNCERELLYVYSLSLSLSLSERERERERHTHTHTHTHRGKCGEGIASEKVLLYSQSSTFVIVNTCIHGISLQHSI